MVTKDFLCFFVELGDPPHRTAPPVPRIADGASLDARLPGLCASVFEALTLRQCKAIYQRCLALDLKEAGFEVHCEFFFNESDL